MTKICYTKNDVIWVTTDDDSHDDLIMDYACTFHMYRNKELFNRYKSYYAG